VFSIDRRVKRASKGKKKPQKTVQEVDASPAMDEAAARDGSKPARDWTPLHVSEGMLVEAQAERFRRIAEAQRSERLVQAGDRLPGRR
jgi:hypothetical protein